MGNTTKVAEAVLADDTQTLMDELCAAYNSPDETVRLRVSSAMKRVAGLHPESMSQAIAPRPDWVLERFDWLIDEIGFNLDQPSAKWSIAQIIGEIGASLDDEQLARAIKLLQHNLESDDDWIVKNATATTLANSAISRGDKALANWLEPQLLSMADDSRKSVAAKGRKLLDLLTNDSLL